MPVLNVRLTRHDHGLVRQRADAAHLTMSEFVRRLVLGRARHTIGTIARTRPYRRRRERPEEADTGADLGTEGAVLNIRLTVDELVALRTRAAAAGLDMSTLVRRRVLR